MDIQRTDGAFPLRSIVVPAGNYYWRQDTTATDLATTIETLVQAAGAELANFHVLVASGMIGMRMGPGQTATVTWTNTTLRDWMRFSGAATAVVDAYGYGSRQGMYIFYSDRRMSECRWVLDANSVQSVADSGLVESHFYGDRPRLLVGLQFPGGPYSAVWGDYHALRALWTDALSQGRTCRIYRATGVHTAYAEQSNPLGYSQGVRVEPKALEPMPLSAGWYDQWTADLVFQLTTV